jgi:hypothetical protein
MPYCSWLVVQSALQKHSVSSFSDTVLFVSSKHTEATTIIIIIIINYRAGWTSGNTLNLNSGNFRFQSRLEESDPDRFFEVPQSQQANTWMVPQLDQSRFLPNPSQFILYQSCNHSLCCIGTDSVLKIIHNKSVNSAPRFGKNIWGPFQWTSVTVIFIIVFQKTF